MSNHDGVSGPGGQHPWTDDQAGWTSDVDRRTAPLKSAAVWGLASAILLVVIAAGWLQYVQQTWGASLWGPLVCAVLAVVALCWAGLAAIAYWVCRVFLPSADEG